MTRLNYCVSVAPSIVTKTDDLTVVQGSRTTLHCQTTGNPTPNITWTTPNAGICDLVKANILLVTENTFWGFLGFSHVDTMYELIVLS